MALADRLRRLEAGAALAPPPSKADWPVADQAAHLIAALQLHAQGRSTYSATARELALLDRLIADGALHEGARELVTPMIGHEQHARERWLRRNWRQIAHAREQAEKRIAWHRENGWHHPTPPYLL